MAENLVDNINRQLQALQIQLNQINLTLRQNSIVPEETVRVYEYRQPNTIEELREFLPRDVKNLPIFTGGGHPSLNEWIQDVSPIMANLNRLMADSPDYHYYLKEIRRKIQGEAGSSLTNNGVPLHWPSMLTALKRKFADKRSLTLLEMQATTLKQGKDNLEVYFEKTNKLLTKMIEAIRLSPDIEEAHSYSHMKQARLKILAYFINGLHERYETTCRAMKPKSLDEAFSMCREIRSSLQMKTLTHVSDEPTSSKNWKNQKKNFHSNGTERITQDFLEVRGNNQKIVKSTHENFSQKNTPKEPPPVPQKPNKFQKNQVEPMDVDQSIQSKKVNYQNFQNKNVYYVEQTKQDEENSETFFDAQSDEELEINFLD